MTEGMRQALDQRRELIETRADTVLDIARAAGEPWTTSLGEPPRNRRQATTWRRHTRTVAAYRDRYGITDDTPLGPEPENAAQKIDAARAHASLHRAQHLAQAEQQEHEGARRTGPDRIGPTI